MARLILFNKPFGVLSQFTDADGHPGLAGFIPVKGVYPAGRLDHDSEGLLLLTDDGQLQHSISHPQKKQPKTYWAQVEGQTSDAAIQQLREGVLLNDGPTRPAKVKVLSEPAIWPRQPPIRFRQSIPTSWLEIIISEGRNRQVRRMTAAVGLPTLRLIRVAVGPWSLNELAPGQWREEMVNLPTPRAKIAAPKPSPTRPTNRAKKS